MCSWRLRLVIAEAGTGSLLASVKDGHRVSDLFLAVEDLSCIHSQLRQDESGELERVLVSLSLPEELDGGEGMKLKLVEDDPGET